MNKQPFYHEVWFYKLNEDQQKEAGNILKGLLPAKLKDTLEMGALTATFTSTEDLCKQVKEEFGKLEYSRLRRVDCEPGDPSDLM